MRLIALLLALCVACGSSGPSDGQVADTALNHLTAERFDELHASFDDAFSNAVTAGQLRELWEATVADSGAYKGHGAVLVRPLAGGNFYEYPLTFEHGEGHVQIVVKEQRVSGLVVRPGKPTGKYGV